VEAGKMELHTEPFSMDQLLQELSLILSSNLNSKPLELLFELDPALPPLLLADALRLKQVLINLGGNAVKFTPEGEVVLRIKVTRREAGRVWLMFTVADTGIGISESQRAVIFRASARPKPPSPGGLVAPGWVWPSPASGPAHGG
jgi:signal transduction histidine kinase